MIQARLVQAVDSATAAMQRGETWPVFRMIAAGVVVVAVLVILGLLVSEYATVKEAGGLKAYTKDLDMVGFSGFRSLLAFEVVLGALVVAVLLHAFLPKLVSELQIDAVWVVAGMAAAGRGINLGAFGIKQANADPAVMVAAAAIKDPSVQPLVTTNKKTGDTTVSVVPSQQATERTEDRAADKAAELLSAKPQTVTAEVTATFAPPPKQPAPVFARDA